MLDGYYLFVNKDIQLGLSLNIGSQFLLKIQISGLDIIY
jgi:hypothetical protein